MSALGHLQHSLCPGQPGASVCVWLGGCVCLSEGVCLGFGGGRSFVFCEVVLVCCVYGLVLQLFCFFLLWLRGALLGTADASGQGAGVLSPFAGEGVSPWMGSSGWSWPALCARSGHSHGRSEHAQVRDESSVPSGVGGLLPSLPWAFFPLLLASVSCLLSTFMLLFPPLASSCLFHCLLPSSVFPAVPPSYPAF